MEKRALVVGLGVSGRAAARFLAQSGYCVTGIDKTKKEDVTLSGVEVVTEEEYRSDTPVSLVVVSPGIPHTHPVVSEAVSRGARLTGEVELGLSGSKQKAIAITGTNGKTTVTSLIVHILTSSGRKARAIGNIGFAACEYFLSPDPEEILVVELSSYQLETMNDQFFEAAALLNITPDHLDRYGDMRTYAQAKARIAGCVKEKGKIYLGSRVVEEYSDLFSLPFEILGKDHFPDTGEYPEHDLANIQAAAALCYSLGVTSFEFLAGLRTFVKPAHRIQRVRSFNGVEYYDDSKGTNVDAVIRAVRAMKGPVILIAGGVDKGASYTCWKEPFSGKIKRIFAIGRAAGKIRDELSLFFNVEIVDSLEDAVQKSQACSIPGDNVLLSPGCSSFDMFRDYAHRGNEFQRFVALLE